MKKKVILILIGCFIAFSVLNFLSILIYPFSPHLTSDFITGNGLLGTLQLVIEEGPFNGEATLTSPQNTTYNFTRGDNLTLLVSATSNFDANWSYISYDLKHNLLNSSGYFGAGLSSVNTNISVARWNNKLIVSAKDALGRAANQTVEFYIFIPNAAPVINNLSNQYICENNKINYLFNVTDLDGEYISIDLNPKGVFWIGYFSFPLASITSLEIFSSNLTKEQARMQNFSEIISVSDGQSSDNRQLNISVIEINNAPIMQGIGVHTIWLTGENSTFYYRVGVNDIENGNQNSGNFTFNLSFLNSQTLFNISNTGLMSFTPNLSQVGVYNITACVTDKPLSNIHPNISLCSQNGAAITSCKNFSLTITNNNRAPFISSYFPLDNSLNIKDTDNLYFGINFSDADGTIPDTYWYLDNSSVKYDSSVITSNFTHVFGCGVSGNYSIKAEITDGLANASRQWNLSVKNVACSKSAPAGSGGGGGGGGMNLCFSKLACGDWQLCQNAKWSYDSGQISAEDYTALLLNCSKNSYDERYCGFQIKLCNDLNNCSKQKNLLNPIQVCYYTENPSCYDKITNCHDGGCELLADCGGPCPMCPSCSDGKQNQGEQGVDCGGPCPNKCPAEVPKQTIAGINIIYYILILIAIIILIVILVKIRNISEFLKKIRSTREDN